MVDWAAANGLTQGTMLLIGIVIVLIAVVIWDSYGLTGRKRVQGQYNSDRVNILGRRVRNTEGGDYLKVRPQNAFNARSNLLFLEGAPALTNARFPTLDEMVRGCPEATVFPEDPAGCFLGDRNASTLVYVPPRARAFVAGNPSMGVSRGSVHELAPRGNELKRVFAENAAEVSRMEIETNVRKTSADRELGGTWFLNQISEPVGKIFSAGMRMGQMSKGGGGQS